MNEGESNAEKRLRVCILSGYPPEIGRGAEQNYNLIEELRQFNGLEITVLANCSSGAPPIEARQDLNILRTWKPGSFVSAVKTVRQVLRIRPDVLHIHHPHLYYGGAVYTAVFISVLTSTARLRGIKTLVWWEHVYPPEKIKGPTLKNYTYRASPLALRIGLRVYTRFLGIISTRTLVQTKPDLVAIKKYYGVKNARSLVIGMAGKPVDKIYARESLGLSPDKKVLLIFGFISPFKGIQFAIEAFPRIKDAFPESVLLIAGCGHPRLKDPEGYVNTFKALAQRGGCAKDIIFRDEYIPASEHSIFYSASDVVLLPYISSLGPSSVGMEAFMHNIPVIASDLDFIHSDIKDGVNGLLIPPSDPDALSDAVIRLFQNESLYATIVSNIQKVARRYDVKEVARELSRVYAGL